MASVADIARVNMLNELSLTEPQNLSNVDLMARVLETPGQTLVTETDASAAIHYQRYIDGLA